METVTVNENKNKDSSIHVLLVDDEYNIVFVNKLVLEQMGYVVHSAHSGNEAIALIEEYRDVIDIIVTDYLMPGMNGVELAVEAGRYLAGTPVILYTGKAEYIDAKQIAEAGIARVIVKPFKMKDLNIVIRDILHKNEDLSP